MNTLIKGTFPVRFRRDGKDGVNVWLKYATVLDLYDSGTGKYYPSNNNIFNNKRHSSIFHSDISRCRRFSRICLDNNKHSANNMDKHKWHITINNKNISNNRCTIYMGKRYSRSNNQ